MNDDGRRHRGRAARRHHLRRGPRPRRRDRHRLRGVAVAGAAGAASSGPRWSSSRPARPRSRRCWTTPTAFETPAVAVLSGGNIDPLLLGKVIRHGMAAAGRYLNLRVSIPDLPGGLAGCSPRSARPAPTCSRSSTSGSRRRCTSTRSRCSLQLETRGEPHAEQVIAPAPRAAATASIELSSHARSTVSRCRAPRRRSRP